MRTFNPIELTDDMTDEQIEFLAVRLHQIIEHGYGYIIITVSNHHVNQLFRRYHEKFPLPKQVKRSKVDV